MWLPDGRRYWPRVRILTSLRRRSRMQTTTSSHSSPIPRMIPDLVRPVGAMRRAWASSHHDPKCCFRTLEVGDQDLDRGFRQPTADLGDTSREGFGAAVRQVVA